MSGPVKRGVPIPVTVENGRPNCPSCGAAMVEVEPGRWQCPLVPKPPPPMTAVMLILAAVISFQAGVFTEWRRVLRYLDRHLDRDPDWLRSGIAEEHHTRRKADR